jgi:beta-phosphoglucomutase-like phosphatase (HAD superfamily)
MDMETMKKEGIAPTPYIEDIFKMPICQCIATGGVREKTLYKIKVTGIGSYFPPERIFTVDMVLHGKPEPDLFLLAAEKCGAKAQDCVVIEDSIAGLTGAIKAGCLPIAFLGGDLQNDQKHENLVRSLGVTDIYHDMRDVKKRIEELF